MCLDIVWLLFCTTTGLCHPATCSTKAFSSKHFLLEVSVCLSGGYTVVIGVGEIAYEIVKNGLFTILDVSRIFESIR